MLLQFTLWELNRLGGIDVFGPALVGAVVSLQAFLDKRGKVGGAPDAESMRSLRVDMDICLRCCREAGIALAPKSHMVTHMVDRHPQEY